MLVTDLDGTLLGPGSVASPRAVAALHRLTERGVAVVFATGRAYGECLPPLRDLLAQTRPESCPLHVIGAGGATLHASDGTLLGSWPLPPHAVRVCADAINDHGHVAHLLHDDTDDDHHYSMVGGGALDEATTWWIESLGLRHRRLPTMPESHSATMRVSAVAPESEIAPIATVVEARARHMVAFRHWPALTSAGVHGAGPHMLEIHAAGVHKWSAAEFLCARLGVAADDVVAIGDGPNDVEMLSNAGLGIAMGDGWEVAKSAADTVCDSCAADGWASAVESLLAEGSL